MKKIAYIFPLLVGILLVQSCGGSKTSKTTTTTPKQTSTPTNTEPKKASDVVKIARSFVGTKYKYGGITRKGIDCSGLSYNVYKEIGITLPRTSSAQSGVGKRVYIGEVVKGDLIFFGSEPGNKRITHIGIVSYSKDGHVKMIHASTSKGVREDAVDKYYWRQRYIRASRPLAK